MSLSLFFCLPLTLFITTAPTSASAQAHGSFELSSSWPPEKIPKKITSLFVFYLLFLYIFFIFFILWFVDRIRILAAHFDMLKNWWATLYINYPQRKYQINSYSNFVTVSCGRWVPITKIHDLIFLIYGEPFFLAKEAAPI